MGPLSLILSLLAKKVGSLLQMVFGWSVTALFGRLEAKHEVAVSAALVLSLAWPIFVLGTFAPGVAAWTLAFLPLHDWIGDRALRVIWLALAVTAPLVVGALVRWVAPSPRGGYARAIVNGYPLAVGFFVSFTVTLVTAPILKVLTVARGWTDTHVFVQAHRGRYEEVVREVAEACARAGALPEIARAPRTMTLATTVLRALASASVAPLIGDDLRIVRAKGVEAYVYPADLLLRGEPRAVAALRAMLSRTRIDGAAYLVRSEEGRTIQDSIERLASVIELHASRREPVGDRFGGRLVAVWRAMSVAKDLPFEEWTVLETLLRRVEREYVEHSVDRAFVVDHAPDELAHVEAEANGRAASFAQA